MQVLDLQHCSLFFREERDWKCPTILPAILTCKNFNNADYESVKMAAGPAQSIIFILHCMACMQVFDDALVLGDGAW